MPQAPLDVLRDKRIGVLCGGQSGEREVSLRSGQGVLEAYLKRLESMARQKRHLVPAVR